MTDKKSHKTPVLGSQLTATMSVALLLLLLGLMGVTIMSAHRYGNSLRRDLALIVKIIPGAETQDVHSLRNQVAKAPFVSSYTYTSADMVLAQEVELMGSDMTDLLDENPYSDELEVHLHPQYLNPDSIDVVKQQLESNEIVDEVVTDITLATGVDNFINRMSVVALIVAVALLLISFVLINNTVSLAIYSRRFLIRTMRLVGASPGFIRAPFIRAGVLSGLTAALIASAILVGLAILIGRQSPEISLFIQWSDIFIVICALIVIGIVICALAAAWSANRYLRRSYDKLYRK